MMKTGLHQDQSFTLSPIDRVQKLGDIYRALRQAQLLELPPWLSELKGTTAF